MMSTSSAASQPTPQKSYPSHGRFDGASSQPLTVYKRWPGDRIGHNWRTSNAAGKRKIRRVLFDANFCKLFVHARFAADMGDQGCLSLFGANGDQYRLFAEHLTAEYHVVTQGRSRTVDEWKQQLERADNHWFDCVVGCAA